VEFINLFFTQEGLLREAQAACVGEIVPPDADDVVARCEQVKVSLTLALALNPSLDP